jgi:putative membrane protein
MHSIRTLAAVVTFGALALATPLAAQTTRPLNEANVVAIFDLANTADIETGRLGATRGQNKEVRDYGQMLSDVHTVVRQQGRDLAKKLGVTPAMPAGNSMARDHAAAVERLGRLSGAEFDKAFLAHEQAFHAAVIEAVKTALLPAIRNAELRKFVTDLAPAFEAHRLNAEQLSKKIGAQAAQH